MFVAENLMHNDKININLQSTTEIDEQFNLVIMIIDIL